MPDPEHAIQARADRVARRRAEKLMQHTGSRSRGSTMPDAQMTEARDPIEAAIAARVDQYAILPSLDHTPARVVIEGGYVAGQDDDVVLFEGAPQDCLAWIERRRTIAATAAYLRARAEKMLRGQITYHHQDMAARLNDLAAELLAEPEDGR